MTVARIAVSPGFFRTLGIPFVSGRDFATTDDGKHPQVVIIDSAIARQLFPSETAIGKHIRFGVQPDMQDLQIVGVAQLARLLDVRDAASRFLYVPALQAGENAEGMTLLVHGYGSPALAKAIEHKVESFGREYSTSTGTLHDRGENAFLYERMIATLSSFFAAIGLITGTASADYIQLYHGNAPLLAESLEVIQQTASIILAALEPAPAQEEAAEPTTEAKPEFAEVA